MAELEPMTTELPPDIIFSNILPKLPAKSISRFKCVSKQWHSFLRTPEFLRMHHLRVINYHDYCKNGQKLLFLPNSRPWVFQTIDCERPKNSFSGSRPFPFEVGPRQGITIVLFLHGMVLLAIKRRKLFENSDIVLWNPTTGDHKTLSKASYPIRYDSLKVGFYYSFSENDYKIVCLNRNCNVYIFSLKSDSWTKVESTVWSENTVPYHLIMSSVFLNKRFHFLRKLFKVKKSSDIASTPSFGNKKTDFMGFMDLGGRIYFCVGIVNSIGDQYDQIELWDMIESGSWRKVRVTSSPKEELYWDDRLHIMRNGNWLMHSDSEENVYVLDTKKHTEDIICSIKIAFRPVGKYTETFVSPNQYMV